MVGDSSWTGLQPKGQEEVHAEGMLLRELFKNGSWLPAVHAWQSTLMPLASLAMRVDGYTGFVIKVYNTVFFEGEAALNQPLGRGPFHSMFGLALHAEE